MELKSLWIGEKLRIKSSGKEGTFEGVVPIDLAKVKVDGIIQFVKSTDLEVVEEAVEPNIELPSELFEQEEAPGEMEHSIDLHIEKLNPKLVTKSPEEILTHQLRRCKDFINQASKRKVPKITIIHGKGTGALRSEVMDLLYHRTDVMNIQAIHDGGGVEVYFQ